MAFKEILVFKKVSMEGITSRPMSLTSSFHRSLRIFIRFFNAPFEIGSKFKDKEDFFDF